MGFAVPFIFLLPFTAPGISRAGVLSCNSSCPVPQVSSIDGSIEAFDEDLHRKEKEALKKGVGKIKESLTKKQAGSYSKFYREFSKSINNYRSLFGENATPDDVIKALGDPAMKTKIEERIQKMVTDIKESYKKNSGQDKLGVYEQANLDRKIIEIKTKGEGLVGFTNAVWVKDPTLKSVLLNAAAAKDSEQRSEVFNQFAKETIEKNADRIESWVTTAYDDEKAEELGYHGADYDGAQLKNLEINFWASSKAQIVDPAHPDYKGMTLEEIVNFVEDQKKSFCFPRPATKAELQEALEENNPPDQGINPPNGGISTVQRVIKQNCDISQSFADNLTALDGRSKQMIEKCINDVAKGGSDGSGPRCKDGIESISATVKSCASTLRPKEHDKGVTNLDLALERAESMKTGFEDAVSNLLGIKASIGGLDLLSLSKYQNLYHEDVDTPEITGTCGPQPYENYANEEWVEVATAKNKNSCVASKELPFDQCLKKFKDKPNRLWQCRPKNKAEALSAARKDLEERIKAPNLEEERRRLQAQLEVLNNTGDPYSIFRKASIQVEYTCKLPPKLDPNLKPGGSAAFDGSGDKIPPVLQTTCGVFLSCIPIRTGIKTHQPRRKPPKFKIKMPMGNGLIPISSCRNCCEVF
ncbi:MAG: hypothetical protein KGP28_05445 [Bdellovibrionales bacterium]|nr:hypothetical protein [Bdellovibrionales bacterium]